LLQLLFEWKSENTKIIDAESSKTWKKQSPSSIMHREGLKMLFILHLYDESASAF